MELVIYNSYNLHAIEESWDNEQDIDWDACVIEQEVGETTSMVVVTTPLLGVSHARWPLYLSRHYHLPKQKQHKQHEREAQQPQPH